MVDYSPKIYHEIKYYNKIRLKLRNNKWLNYINDEDIAYLNRSCR